MCSSGPWELKPLQHTSSFPVLIGRTLIGRKPCMWLLPVQVNRVEREVLDVDIVRGAHTG